MPDQGLSQIHIPLLQIPFSEQFKSVLQLLKNVGSPRIKLCCQALVTLVNTAHTALQPNMRLIFFAVKNGIHPSIHPSNIIGIPKYYLIYHQQEDAPDGIPESLQWHN
jgi:hypothetical protein